MTELLLAWDDGTWTTDVFDVPLEVTDYNGWFFEDGPGKTARFRGLVLVTLYSDYVDSDDPRLNNDPTEE